MTFATETDACREYARNVGRENPDRAWIGTHYDTWERNPFYVGPPQRHPEDDSDEELYQQEAADGCGFAEVPF